MTKVTKAKAIERLKKALDTIPSLKNFSSSSPEFKKWRRNTEVAIANTFGENARHVKDFTGIRFSLMFVTDVTPDSEFQRAFVKGLESAASVLESMIEEIGEYWEDDTPPGSNATPAKRKPDEKTNDVFIIHGHDVGSKDTVARFITKIGLTPVILHEQPNQGQTIIEKFEQHAPVGFALALLTPDDIGTEASKRKDLKPRARQNVIFEFGYFMGRIGRQRVCALTKGNIEIPSDYSGVLYIPLDDSGAWKMILVRELKSAGFNVDANLAL